MRKIIEYTLVSVDGVFAGAAIAGFAEHRDKAYMRDGLGQALACGALLMGRTTYEDFAAIWPRRTDPWADRINAMPKYVFSSTLEKADWNNSTILRGDVEAYVTKLKQQEGRDISERWRSRAFADRLVEEAKLDGALETIPADKLGTQPMREERSAR